MELPKRYNFKDIEKKVIDKVIQHVRKEKGKILVIDTPPPYPAPVWHIGAVLSYILQDFIARSHRLLGYNVIYPCGFDGNGLPIEIYLEKYEGIPFGKVEREKYIEICRKKLDEWRAKMQDIMKKVFLSMDYENCYRTDDDNYRKFTQETFIELWKKGLIVEEERPNNWCPHCKTTVADAEVEYKKMKGILATIRFKVKEGGYIDIATTRPELLGACSAIIVNPEDERYKGFVGKHAIVPIYNREIPIVAHPSANPEFGTGAVMVCSYGDWNDVQLFRELRLKPRKLIDTDGKMTEEAGPLAGLTVEEARRKIIDILSEEGHLIEVKDYEHEVPVHERCNTPIQIIPMKEYYLKQLEFKEDMLKLIEELNIIPEKYRVNLKNWIESISTDWPISRRRYYGTEIPIWICKKCGYKYVPEPGKYYKPWKEKLNIKCPRCGSTEWEGEKRVFDTWMDSSVTILYVLRKYGLDFDKVKTLRPQGYDIIRTWLYYTLLRVYQLTGKIAFDYVVINGMGLDKYGRKMSKRYGNVIEPEKLINEYGGDALRLWFALEVTVGEDYRINEDKIRGVSKFLNKLWNIARFVSMFEKEEKVKELKPTDRWILEEVKLLKNKVIKHYKNFEFLKAAKLLYNFTWDIFASHYIELVKNRAKQGDKSARYTLYKVLNEILKLWHPIIPGITYYLYETIFGKNILNEEIEEERVNYMILWKGRKILEFNKFVWSEKQKRNLKLSDPIDIKIPEELKEFEEDLRNMHKIVS